MRGGCGVEDFAYGFLVHLFGNHVAQLDGKHNCESTQCSHADQVPFQCAGPSCLLAPTVATQPHDHGTSDLDAHPIRESQKKRSGRQGVLTPPANVASAFRNSGLFPSTSPRETPAMGPSSMAMIMARITTAGLFSNNP